MHPANQYHSRANVLSDLDPILTSSENIITSEWHRLNTNTSQMVPYSVLDEIIAWGTYLTHELVFQARLQSSNCKRSESESVTNRSRTHCKWVHIVMVSTPAQALQQMLVHNDHVHCQ